MITPPAAIFCAVLSAALYGALAARTSDAADQTATLFAQAIDEAHRGDVRAAIGTMELVRQALPDNANVHWNLGIWKAEVGDHAGALAAWQEYRRLEPDDWPARAKLIQAHQALGQLDARDHQRRTLFELRRKGQPPELAKADRYCREQFVAGGRKVMVFEFFEPAGPRRVFYRFSVRAPSGGEDYWFSLGSYDATTQVAWEAGEVPRNVRLHHLDRYDAAGSHSTLGFYRGMPPYEAVRDRVRAALEDAARLSQQRPRGR